MMCCLTHWFSKLLNLTIRSEMTVLLALYFLCTLLCAYFCCAICVLKHAFPLRFVTFFFSLHKIFFSEDSFYFYKHFCSILTTKIDLNMPTVICINFHFDPET